MVEGCVDGALTMDGVFLVRPSLIVVGIDGNTGHIDPRAAEKLLIDISDAIDRTVAIWPSSPVQSLR